MNVWVLLGAWLLTVPYSAGQDEFQALFTRGTSVAEDTQLQRVGERLRLVKILRAPFVQEKRIKVLRRPLISKGDFLFATDQGVWWHTTHPFETSFTITPKGIRQQTDQAEPLVIAASEQPVIHGFTGVFMSLFAGDTSVLEDRFHLFFEGDEMQWTIGLKPKGKIMGKLIERIVLQGKHHIDTLHVFEPGGDVTVIRFDQVVLEPAQLSEEERRHFDF